MATARRTSTGYLFTRAFSAAITAPLFFVSAAHAVCVVDEQGANDQPGQKGLTQFYTINSSPILGDDITWNWDDIQFSSSASTNDIEDGCALYDTDNDGKHRLLTRSSRPS